MDETRRIVVTGRVQGVFYRGWTVETARGLGLDGWVRNRADGSVEILARGSRPALDALEEKCRHGPRAARVERVSGEPSDEAVEPGFRQRETR